MKFKRKWTSLLMGIVMGAFMSFLMSLVVSLINVGPVDGFIFIWMRAWGAAFAISLPIVVVVFPVAKKIVDSLLE
jgi:hypothetical protein